MTQLILDTHLHIYPAYNLEFALNTMRTNLSKIMPGATCGGILVEPLGCRFFKDLINDPGILAGEKRTLVVKNNSICIEESGFADFYLFPGRQIVCRENIEILCLLIDLVIENGLPAQEVIEIISKSGGVPVLSWSPGKWLFKRRNVIKNLIHSNQPGSLLIGDSSLRPKCWPMPPLMKAARKKGFGIIAGSDALPFSGDEKWMGSYATLLDFDFDKNYPETSLHAYLSSIAINPTTKGSRVSLPATIYRLLKLRQQKQSNNG